jgi:hypothetical protein
MSVCQSCGHPLADGRRDEYRVGTTISRERVMELAIEHGVSGMDVDGFVRECMAEALRGRPREEERVVARPMKKPPTKGG